MNKFNRYNRIFLAAEGTESGGTPVVETLSAPGVDVPVLESPVAADIQEVSIPDSNVKGPGDLFGEDPEQQMAEADAKMGKETRERGPDGKFLPKKKEGEPEPAVKVVKPKAKPVVEKAVEPVVPAKLKLGDEEKTADEWLAEMKKLREGAKPPEAKIEPEDDKAKVAEQEAQTKDLTERREKFITDSASRFAPTEKEWDVALSGGPEAVKMLGTIVARNAAAESERLATGINKALAAQAEEFKPILEMYRQVQAFNEENQALSSNVQLKAHPQGLETYRRIKDEYQKSYDDITARVAAGQQVTPQEQGWAMLYAGQKPDELRATIAERAAIEVARIPLKTNGNGAPKQPEMKAAPRITTPLKTDRPGGAAPAVKTESQDARMAREFLEGN